MFSFPGIQPHTPYPIMCIWVVATQLFFMFTPKIGEDEPILTSMFQLTN